MLEVRATRGQLFENKMSRATQVETLGEILTLLLTIFGVHSSGGQLATLTLVVVGSGTLGMKPWARPADM